jgi:hypothetical protein
MSGNSWQTTPAAQNLYNALTANNLTSPSAAQEVLKIGSLSPTFQQLVTNFVSAGGTFNFTSHNRHIPWSVRSSKQHD